MTLGLAIAACVIGIVSLALGIVNQGQLTETQQNQDQIDRELLDLQRAWARENPEPWTWPEREHPKLYDVERDDAGVPIEEEE